MHRLTRAFFVLVFLVAATGCDSTDDEPRDAELIVGSWRVVSASDGTGDRTADLAALGTIRIDFGGDNTFEIEVDTGDPSRSTSLSGTYVVNETLGRVALTAQAQGVPATITFEYDIESNNRVAFSTDAQTVQLLNLALGGATDFSGAATLVVERA